MTEPILDKLYWRQRLHTAQERHHAVFRCPLSTWLDINAKHKEILQRTIKPTESILDAGCGWGRLLDLLPREWKGNYLGIDLSPDFIDMARDEHPQQAFLVADLRQIPVISGTYDWAVMISIRPMMRRNLGDEIWEEMEREVRRVARQLLYLEYDPSDEGSIE